MSNKQTDDYIGLLGLCVELYKKTKRLVEKMDEIHSSQDYIGIFAFAQNNGMPYTGPTYSQELEDVKNILNKLEQTPPPSKIEFDSSFKF